MTIQVDGVDSATANMWAGTNSYDAQGRPPCYTIEPRDSGYAILKALNWGNPATITHFGLHAHTTNLHPHIDPFSVLTDQELKDMVFKFILYSDDSRRAEVDAKDRDELIQDLKDAGILRS